MPNYKYIVDILAKNGQFVQAMNQNIQKTAELDKKVLKLGGMLAGAFSTTAVLAFGKASIEAYNQSAQAETALLTALKGRTSVQQHLIQQASELQGKTLFDDDETVRAQSLIAAFVREESQIKTLIPLVQDFATAKQMDLASAADLVTKTLAGEMNALGRYGIKVEGAANSSERLKMITDGLNNAFGGQAEAAAKVGSAALQQLSNEYGNLMEVIGKLTISQQNQEGSFTKLLTEATKGLTGFLGDVSTWSDAGFSFSQSIVAAFASTKEETQKLAESMIVSSEANEQNAESGNKAAEAAKYQAGSYGALGEEITKLNEQLLNTNANDIKSIQLIGEKIAKIEKLQQAVKSISTDPASFRQDQFQQLNTNTTNVSVSGSEDVSKWTSQLDSMNSVLTRNKELADSLASSWNSFGEQYWNVVDKMMKGGENINAMHIAAGNFVSEMMGFAESGANSMDQFAEAAREAAMKVINTYIAEGVAGAVSTALAKSGIPFPLNMVAGAVAAAGATTLFNSMIPAFNFGGEVPGNSFTGDRMLIRANSGEEVLTRSDPRHRLNRGGMASGGSAVILQPSIEYGLDTFRIRLKRVESNVGKRT